MKPYYSHAGITIYHGDCREVVLSRMRCDLLITDPPYGINLNTDYLTGRNQLERSSSSKVWERIAGDSSPMNFGFLFSVAGKKVVFGANNFPQQIPFDSQADGWICWDKRVTEEADRILGSPFELAVVIGQRMYEIIRLQHCGVKNADGDDSGRFHPTQKPIRLMKKVISFFSGCTTVIDPFCGSGSTLRAAKELGKSAIGIEIEEKYCEIAAKRLSQEVFDFK